MPYITYSISGEYRKDILCTSFLLCYLLQYNTIQYFIQEKENKK